HGRGIGEGVVIVTAVEHVIVLIAAGAVDGDGGVLREIHAAGAGDYTGNKELELERIAAVERKFGDTLRVYNFLDGAAYGFHEPHRASHGDGIRGLTQFEDEISGAGLVGVEMDVFGNELTEAGVGGFEAVVPDSQAGKVEASAAVGEGIPLLAGG